MKQTAVIRHMQAAQTRPSTSVSSLSSSLQVWRSSLATSHITLGTSLSDFSQISKWNLKNVVIKMHQHLSSNMGC